MLLALVDVLHQREVQIILPVKNLGHGKRKNDLRKNAPYAIAA